MAGVNEMHKLYPGCHEAGDIKIEELAKQLSREQIEALRTLARLGLSAKEEE